MDEPPAAPELEASIDEREHQALDLLDALRCGKSWIAAQEAQDEVSGAEGGPHRAGLEAEIVHAGEDPRQVAEAEETVRGLLIRLIGQVARTSIDAAEALSKSGAELELGVPLAAIEFPEVRRILNASPQLCPSIASAVETTGMILGLDPSSIAWALLLSLGEEAQATAPSALRECSSALDQRLRAAWPTASSKASPVEAQVEAPIVEELRIFRSATLVAAGPSIRARSLAAEHPEHLGLALALVERLRDPRALVESFDAARAPSDTPTGQTPPATDGPKRRFTWLHAVLAAIVLGLTLWHYLWR